MKLYYNGSNYRFEYYYRVQGICTIKEVSAGLNIITVCKESVL